MLIMVVLYQFWEQELTLFWFMLMVELMLPGQPHTHLNSDTISAYKAMLQILIYCILLDF
ncbi:hypothetical protein Tsubulata_027836 [Turnera subulata]|uniref:Uncharacterized protein n=1 Tax=Turnera subulata TaxID=218843 RepID=A0A9Q0G7Q3_9ROSI|nr:hypothetical protein Tsubulata_027836 [Turnera subulata]